MGVQDAARRYLGAPPYDDGGNITRGDGYFYRDSRARYGKARWEKWLRITEAAMKSQAGAFDVAIADALEEELGLGPCCENETRNMNGGCDNCGDPCI